MTDDEQRDGGQAAAGGGNEVEKRTGKRRFSDAYRVRIVEEANRCTRPGEIAALLRREGLCGLPPKSGPLKMIGSARSGC